MTEVTLDSWMDQLLLAIFYYVWPDASAKEASSFIFNNNGGLWLYSPQAIRKWLGKMDITWKSSSTEAYQAFPPQNHLKLHLFFTQGPPLGISGVDQCHLIDIDEFGISLERINKEYGYTHVSVWVWKPGHYTRDTKVTVIVAFEPGDPTLPDGVDGSLKNLRRWVWVQPYAGTDQVTFAYFCDYVCHELEQHPAPYGLDNDHIIMWDNLRAHLTDLVYETVQGQETPNIFQIVRHPLYQPKYAPIKYIICEITSQLQKEITVIDTTAMMIP